MNESKVLTISMFLISAFLVYVVTWIFILTPLVGLFQDRPGLRKIHQRMIPSSGGIGVVISFLLVLLFQYYFNTIDYHLVQIMVFISISVLVTGFLHDSIFFAISNTAYVLLQLIIACIILWHSHGYSGLLPLLPNFFATEPMAFSLSILWILGICNAFAVIDLTDGLATVLSIIIFLSLSALFLLEGNISYWLISITMTGLFVGLLVHTAPPARVFLGDTGCMFTGMTYGFLSLQLFSIAPQEKHPVISILLIVGLVILNVFSVMIWRFNKSLKGEKSNFLQAIRSTSIADNEHFPHRLAHRGLNHAQILIVLTLISSSFSLCGVISFTGYIPAWVIMIYVITSAVIILIYLGYISIPTNNNTQKQKIKSNQLVKVDVVVCNTDEVFNSAITSYSQPFFNFLIPLQSNTAEETEIRENIKIVIIDCDSLTKQQVIEYIRQYLNVNSVFLIMEKGYEYELYGEGKQIQYLFKPIYLPILIRVLMNMMRNEKVDCVEDFGREKHNNHMVDPVKIEKLPPAR